MNPVVDSVFNCCKRKGKKLKQNQEEEKGKKIGCNKIIQKNGFLPIEGATQVLQIGSNS